jgi:hypothetical protein
VRRCRCSEGRAAAARASELAPPGCARVSHRELRDAHQHARCARNALSLWHHLPMPADGHVHRPGKLPSQQHSNACCRASQDKHFRSFPLRELVLSHPRLPSKCTPHMPSTCPMCQCSSASIQVYCLEAKMVDVQRARGLKTPPVKGRQAGQADALKMVRPEPALHGTLWLGLLSLMRLHGCDVCLSRVARHERLALSTSLSCSSVAVTPVQWASAPILTCLWLAASTAPAAVCNHQQSRDKRGQNVHHPGGSRELNSCGCVGSGHVLHPPSAEHCV